MKTGRSPHSVTVRLYIMTTNLHAMEHHYALDTIPRCSGYRDRAR